MKALEVAASLYILSGIYSGGILIYLFINFVRLGSCRFLLSCGKTCEAVDEKHCSCSVPIKYEIGLAFSLDLFLFQGQLQQNIVVTAVVV